MHEDAFMHIMRVKIIGTQSDMAIIRSILTP